MSDVKIVLVSSNGQELPVSLDAIQQSETVKNLIDDAGIESPIPVSNVTDDVLKDIIRYCEYHHAQGDTRPVSEGNADEKRTDDITPWDLNFCKVSQERLFEYVLAANYLDIKSLLDLTCKTIANMIKGKTPAQIRETFGVKDDFTPQEEEQICKENEWCEER